MSMSDNRQPLSWLQPGAFDLRPGERIEPHRHDRHQLVYAAAGVLAITTPQGVWIAPSQRAVWIPAGTQHAHRAHGPTEMRSLLFPAELSGPSPDNTPVIVAVSPLLRQLVLTLVQAPPADADERRRLEQVTVDQLHRLEPLDDRLRAIDRLLRQAPGEHYRVADLGQRVGASERTILRLCRRELGMTLQQWRTQLRLVQALELLADGTPVIVTAHRCGWANPSDFIATFAAVIGSTPGVYQAQLRKSG
jgi:AraC-like DNA-binding protein